LYDPLSKEGGEPNDVHVSYWKRIVYVMSSTSFFSDCEVGAFPAHLDLPCTFENDIEKEPIYLLFKA
jgi:hypothetical protein